MNLRRQQWCAALLVGLLLLVPLWHGFDKPGTVMDEGALLVYPELIAKGKLPYRDFETFYGPANLYVLATAYRAFGTNIFVERGVGLVYRLLIISAAFLLARPWGIVVASGCMAVTGFLVVQTGLGAFAWIGGLACLLWSLWLMCKADSTARVLAGGIMAGCTLLFRPDLVVALGLSALPVWLVLPRTARWKYVAGAALAVLPLAVLTLLAGWDPICNNLLLFPVFRSSPGRRLPVLSADLYLICLLVLHLIASLFNAAVGATMVRTQPREIGARLFFGSALLGLGLTHQVVQRLDLMHVLSAAIVSIGLLPLSLTALLSGTTPAHVRRWPAALAIMTVLAILAFAAPELFARFRNEVISTLNPTADDTGFVKINSRSFPLGAADRTAAANEIVAALTSLAAPGQKLFVGPADLRRTNYNNTFFYHLLPQLVPATYFLEMNPLSANRPDSRLAADVQSADWLLLDRTLDNWNEPNRSIEFGSDSPNVIVRDHFELVKESGNYLLYRKTKSLTAAG
jgi:hypothetical protein